ncbi:MAG: hypothetical protein SA378_11215 [Sedimentibacter sp.]|uniref:hypothetical protein n=1 Tax=Sedimentibacter sp. TaxID=1960295 RepID=UPI0029824648|nr:hypothetical protein [Sedimentibacter sp.]MDW5300684.1 hypothetical protein [Sedimentibacter sp.]
MKNKRFILIDPSGEYIIYPKLKDEISHPDSLIINNYLIDNLINNVSSIDLYDYVNKFLDDYDWILNRDLIIKEICLEVFIRKHGLNLTSGT